MSTKIYFCVDSTQHSLPELIELLGMQADEGWSKGDSYLLVGKPRIYSFSRWQLNEFCNEVSWFEETSNQLVERLRPLLPNFLSLPAEVRKSLSAEITTSRTLFGLGISKETIHFLAQTGAEIDTSWMVRNAETNPAGK